MIDLDPSDRLVGGGGLILSAAGRPLSLLDGLINCIYGYSIDLEGRDGSYVGGGLLITLGAEVAGCCLWSEGVAMDGSKLFFLYGGVVPAHRERGLGSSLIAAALSDLRVGNPGSVVVVTLPAVPYDAGRSKYQPCSFWISRGFKHSDTQVLCVGRTYDPAPENAECGYGSRLHSIEDKASENEIVKLYNRMLLTRFGVTMMTPQQLRFRLVDELSDCIMVERSGELAGIAIVLARADQCYTDTIAVGREHWRSRATDFVGRAIMRYASQKGSPLVTAMTARSNAPALSFMRRHGVLPLYENPRLSYQL